MKHLFAYFIACSLLAGCGSSPSPEGSTSKGASPAAAPKFDVSKVEGIVLETLHSGVQRGSSGGTTPGTNIGVYTVHYHLKNNADVPIVGIKFKIHSEIPGTKFQNVVPVTMSSEGGVQATFTSNLQTSVGVLMPGQMTELMTYQIPGVDRADIGKKMKCRIEITDIAPLPESSDYRSPENLQWLIMEGDLAKIKTAFEADPSLFEIQNTMTLSAMHFAAMQPKVEVIKYLESIGGDVMSFTEGRESTIHFAALSSREMVDYLHSKGVPTFPEPGSGLNPLHYAVWANNPKTIKALVKAGASVSQRDISAQTPLMVAIRYGNLACYRELVAAGAKLDHRGNEGVGVVTNAVYSASIPMIEQVVKDRGGSIKEVSTVGRTPLHYAVWYGEVEMVKWLIAKGADPKALDRNKESAIDLAYQQPFPYLQEELLKAMGQ